jgi:hypothetical protein
MSEPIKAPTTRPTAPTSAIPFEDCDYSVRETLRILAARPTNFWANILPKLDSYLDGNRRKITGESIQRYRANKLAEASQKSAVGFRGSKQLHKSRNEKRRSRKSGSAP